MELMVILIAGLSGLVYSAIWYIGSVIDVNNPKTLGDFDVVYFLVTGIIGAGIGVSGVLAGVDITQQYILVQIGLYGAVTAIVTRYLKVIYNNYIAPKFGWNLV